MSLRAALSDSGDEGTLFEQMNFFSAAAGASLKKRERDKNTEGVGRETGD